MKTPRLILLLALVCAAPQAWAQFGLSAGALQVNNLETPSAVASFTNTISNSGLYAGAFYEKPAGGKTFLEFGATYAFFSGKLGDMKTSYQMLNVPVRVKYKVDLSTSAQFPVRLFAFFGPMLSLGVSAVEDNTGNPYLQKPVVSLYDEKLNRLDMKIGAGAGFELFDHLALKAGYDRGLLDLSTIEGIKTAMHYFYAGVDFLF